MLMLIKSQSLYKSAEEHGKGTEYISEVSLLQNRYPDKTLELIYQEAYENVMNT
jgi:hypothetical protein